MNVNGDKRVVVAMSGGVDSSVAAALLVEQGFEVIGMMMRLWSEPGSGLSAPLNRCCTPDQMADARRIAGLLGIPFYVIDVQEHFRNTIVQFFIEQHEMGRTPNPCIECNRQIRFTYLLERALALDADYLATGHYAQVVPTDRGYELRRASDAEKDQSYVLHMLTQQQLARVVFPVGAHTKSEVRALARKFNLPVAGKDESQDLCFLGDGDYRRFLREYSEKVSQPGPILDEHGRHLGQHNGLSFYTIGQRKGLGISIGKPVFVLHKDAAQNALIVGPREALGRQTLVARDVNWMSGDKPAEPLPVTIKIRYKAGLVAGTVAALAHGRATCTFHEPVFGVTAGQAVVFYEDETVLGGGIIADEMKESTQANNPTLQPSHIKVLS